jgi:phosphoesterase RecJ-like protein
LSDPCQQICELIRAHKTFLVLTHYRPDGDAVGSQLAIVLLLKDLGKQVEAWNDDEVPAKFGFLPHTELVTKPPAEKKDFDVVIAIDVSTWARVGTAMQRIGEIKSFVNIDHHISNEKYAAINWIDPESAASGQMVYELIKRGGFNLTKEIATCLFAAVSTDTGSFTYSNTRAETFRVAAELVATGIDVGEVCRHIYESYPFARLQLLQKALADITLADNSHIAYCWVTNEMFEESGAKREDTEGLIDYARSIDGVCVAVLFEELTEPNKVRISLRSKHPNVDVNAVARRFGGGGHREAAGARIAGDMREIEAKVLAAVSAELRKAGL